MSDPPQWQPTPQPPVYPGGQGWNPPPTGQPDQFGQYPDQLGATPEQFTDFPPPPPPTKRPWWRRGVVLIRGGIAVVIVVSIIVGWLGSARRDDSGAIASGGTLSVTDLRIGDCFDDPGEDEINEVAAIPCNEPHDFEVFHITQLTNPVYPTDDQLISAVETQCLPVFQTYVGIAYADSQLDINWVSPTRGSWDEGDRTMSCFALNTDGSKLTASVQASNR